MASFSAPVLTVFYQGQVAAGAQVFIYQTGTTTPVTTYADSGLTTPNANPIIADANGQVVFYMPTTTAIKIVMETAGGTLIKTLDPVFPVANFTGATGAEATLPSASTTDLGSTGVNLIKITGTTTITSFGSSALTTNPLYYVRFTGALTLTHNGTSLMLPGAANISTQAGDAGLFEYLDNGNWQCLLYQPGQVSPPGGQNLTSGYIKHAGGLIEQWGTTPNLVHNGFTTLSFPIPFPNNAFSLLATPIVNSGTENGQAASCNILSKTQFTVSNTGSSGSYSCFWCAKGN